jgi:nesprin-1
MIYDVKKLSLLQEFVVLKEEGQSLMHATQTWGDKTANTSSAEGRDLITQELQALQRDWDNFVSGISNTRITLESCLLQWSDFDNSSEQIQRWLKDMERRLKDNEPKTDLGEKKAKLQRIKVM